MTAEFDEDPPAQIVEPLFELASKVRAAQDAAIPDWTERVKLTRVLLNEVYDRYRFDSSADAHRWIAMVTWARSVLQRHYNDDGLCFWCTSDDSGAVWPCTDVRDVLKAWGVRP